MKHHLVKVNRQLNLDAKELLKPTIDELCELLRSGRTYIKIIEVLRGKA